MENNSKSSIVVTCIMVLIPIYLGRIQELIPALSALHIGKVAMVVSLILLCLTWKNDSSNEFNLWQVSQVKYIVIILGIMLLSIPFSLWRGGSVDFLNNHVKLLLFVLLIVKGVKSPADIRKISWSYAITIMALALFSLLAPKMVQGRIFASSTYDPNDMALVMAMSVPLLFYMMEAEIGLKKLVLLATLALMMTLVLKTGSRGGVLALLTVAGIILYRKGCAYTLKRVPLLLVVLLLGISFTSGDLRERYADFFAMKQDYNTSAQGGRLEIWKRGLSLMVTHPLLGTGAGTYTIADGSTHEGGKWSTAHNSFVLIGVELGIIALIIQIKLIQRAIQAVRREVETSPLPWFPKGVEIGLYGYCVGGFFLSWAYASLFYFFIALSILHLKITGPLTGSSENTDSPAMEFACNTEDNWR
jgi:O-antigen ligase